MKIITIAGFVLCSSLALSSELRQEHFEDLPPEIHNFVFECVDLEPQFWGRLTLTDQLNKKTTRAAYKKRWTDFIKHLLTLADSRLPGLIDVEAPFNQAPSLQGIYQAGVAILKTELKIFEEKAQLPLDAWQGLEIFKRYRNRAAQSASIVARENLEKKINAREFCLIDICLWNNYAREYFQLSSLTNCKSHTFYSDNFGRGHFMAGFVGSCFSGNPLILEFILSLISQDGSTDVLKFIVHLLASYVATVVHFSRPLIVRSATEEITTLFKQLPDDQAQKLTFFLKNAIALLKRKFEPMRINPDLAFDRWRGVFIGCGIDPEEFKSQEE